MLEGVLLILGASSELHSQLHSSFSLIVPHTVKTFGLLQPYFGHLSCMPVVYVTCCKTSKDASNQNQSLSVVEKLLLSVKVESC